VSARGARISGRAMENYANRYSLDCAKTRKRSRCGARDNESEWFVLRDLSVEVIDNCSQLVEMALPLRCTSVQQAHA
jgi:hypothetical protein